MKSISVIALAACLAGCASVSAVPAGTRVDVGDGVSVAADPAWNQIRYGKSLLWTGNGIGLDEMRFTTGIKDGKPLYGAAAKDTPLYNATMPPSDIADLVVTMMGRSGLQNVRASRLTPCPFGAGTGFCFDVTFLNADGLEMKGKVLAGRKGTNLELIEFRAPSEYYFGVMAAPAQRLFASVQMR